MSVRLKARQRLGKYVIERRLASGGYADVYAARDTIEGVRVALKLPHTDPDNSDSADELRREVRLVAKLDHPNVLPIKNADVINGRLVIATALAKESLGDRLERRLSARAAFEFAEQMLDGLAYAHDRSIVHCDVKPDNFLLFDDGEVRLADFGIARVAYRTLKASGAGTLGYVAPEQAMGSPSLRSDVFSLGLTFWRMFSGRLPEWPYQGPLPGEDRLRSNLHPDFVAVLRRAVAIDPKHRYADAGKMQSAVSSMRKRAVKPKTSAVRAGRRRSTSSDAASGWRKVQRAEFLRRFGKQLEARYACDRCEGPVSEAMAWCPWCGDERTRIKHDTRMPQVCGRCHRGMKLDWSYCPWCYGPGFERSSERDYADKKYTAKCHNPSCERRDLMPWMRYCPWCHTKVRRAWKIGGTREKCGGCGWGILSEYWVCCPWCGDPT